MAPVERVKKRLTIVLTGGGTGGHITPILTLAHELKRLEPDCRLVYIGERHGKFAHFIEGNPNIDEIYTIFAGKLRRYHGEPWLRRLTDVKTILLNARDVFFVAIGYFQSLRLLSKLKPDAVFLKGGFVGMPVGLAAATTKRKFITHDSDALPGLANRVVSKWAAIHATGMPPEFYRYSKDSVRYVGVLVSKDYKPVTPELKRRYRRELGVPETGKVLFVTGGSLGAQRLNLAMVEVAPKLVEEFKDLTIIHQTGKGNGGTYGGFVHERILIEEFLQELYLYSGAADVIVTRAGANTLAEFSVQKKACIVVPNPQLTGGHQLKNVQHLAEQDAVVVVDEGAFSKDSSSLYTAIRDLLNDEKRQQELGSRLQKITPPDAAEKLAMLLLDIANS
jgi:UDP-N-acetylglucosamine--N-acetylmuramyl-(pentapeptide) pyrophosphoryl-undecaprenol N-acetylglucosamine transferase